MQMDHRYKEEYVHFDEKDCLPLSRDIRLADRTVSPRSHMENEKRLRREIANSNERRRMQSINAGFQSLRALLPSHEGEKLSKAAILQQTAEYIYTLEQEKTRLLSQNCQLKRLLNQHEGESHPTVKKRKVDSTADEGSLSPEPSSLSADGESGVEVRRDVLELRMQLERERRLRLGLEAKLRELEVNVFPEGLHLTYEPHDALAVLNHAATTPTSDIGETVEEMEVPLPLLPDELDGSELISSSALPPVVQTQTVSTTPDELKMDTDETDGDSASRLLRRLPSVIEAAIKAEPKVEVERLPTPGSGIDEGPSSTSRQNLETIVEAIRHLEGDHLFSDIPSPGSPPQRLQPVQDVPLALTTKHQTPQRLIKVDMNPFLKFHTSQALQHQRPGVIVVKHT